MPLVSARQVTTAAASAYAARGQHLRWRTDPAGWAKHHDIELWSKQREILQAVADHSRVAVRSCHSSGKALAFDTPLPTPTGWTTMGDVQPGDTLYDEQGKPTTVLSCSDIQWRDTFRVTFDDGTSLVATDDHRWAVIDLKIRHALRVRRANHAEPAPADWREHWVLTEVHTTAELVAAGLRLGGQLRWAVPNCRSLTGTAVDLPVPPYTLGFWFGDGTSVHGAATIGHRDAAEVLAQIRSEGVQVRERPSTRRAGCSGYGLLGIRGGLVRLGVLGNKHVPDAVLRADEATRLAVLQGFMDADGGASNGSAETCVTNKQLADGIAELVTSLGWKVHRSQRPALLYGRECGTRYYVRFRPDRPVFRLTRKVNATRLPTGHRSRTTTRTIVAIDRTPIVPARCVAVDSPSRLYLAGQQMVPTHNTFDAAVLCAWWLDTWSAGTARVITTAPTGDQIRGQLWPEIGGLWAKIPGLPGRVNQTEVWIGNWQAGVGRKSSDYQPAALQGWHAEHLLVIVDEADGISPALWGAVDTLASNAGAKIVGIGNPDDPQSEFRRRQSDQPYGGRYHTIRIAAWDTPNFTGEPVSGLLSSVLLAPSWVETMRRQWGGDPDTEEPPDHPFWASKVEAEYPDEAANTVIRVADLVRARNFERDSRLRAVDDRTATVAGVDLAGSDTGDESVVRGRRGLRLLDASRIRTADPEELEDWVVARLDALQAGEARIDADGLGFGIFGAVRRLRGAKMAVVAVRSAVQAGDPKAFVNRRAEMWWQLREALAGRGDLQLDFTVLDDATAGQLLMPRYTTVKGRIQVESKVDLRKRLGRSPDDADAVVYCVARAPGGGTVRVGRARATLTR